LTGVTTAFDVAVVGLGAMGSAAAYHLARRGHRVLGVDRFAPPHDLGSSHGLTRIIREAYFEHPRYVPLIRRAFELWRELEAESEKALLERNGGLSIGPAEGMLVRGVLASVLEHGIDHEVLTPAELRERFPRYVAMDGWVGVFEPGAGFLRPEACISAHLDAARRHGADVRLNCVVLGWSAAGDAVRIDTTQGRFHAGHLVIAAGAWAGGLTPELGELLRVERQVSHWFTPADHAGDFTPARMPVSMWEVDGGRIFYTTPDVGRGVKAAFHHGGEFTTPETVRRTILPNEQTEVQRVLRRLVPAAAGAPCGFTVCLYTDTPDEHFLIDRHPTHTRVVLVSPCSGHGFKFSAAIGEVAADLVEQKRPHTEISAFAMSRFPAPSGSA